MRLEAVLCDDHHHDMNAPSFRRCIPRLLCDLVPPLAAALVGRADELGVPQHPAVLDATGRADDDYRDHLVISIALGTGREVKRTTVVTRGNQPR